MTAETRIQVMFPHDGDGDQWDVSNVQKNQRVPAPKYRHGAPSAPWPWMDFDMDEPDIRRLSFPSDKDKPWNQYPQSLFGNWTQDQVQRCRMLTICKDEHVCHIHKVDMFADGSFAKLEGSERTCRIHLGEESAKEFWSDLYKPATGLRLRALFIENITLGVLQMLGTRYNIEPVFFASSANWIPSRYQETPQNGQGDHITVVLPFICAIDNERMRPVPTSPNPSLYPPENGPTPMTDEKQTIDTQAPLVLSNKKILMQDLLAIHMVRDRECSTIISYHHHSDLQKTTARRLRSLVERTGFSVYWSKLYRKSKDPTFVFLAIMWYALYAWDEALEVLYAYLSEQLEATDIVTNIDHTHELHKLQAHLLYYQQLLCDFRKSVEFVRDTPNPAMDSDDDRENSMRLLTLESNNLLGEVERLERQREIQSDRLKNAMALALTQATLRDSAAMKLISYLTMVFLPATFLSSVFGMNVAEINPGTRETLGAYVESTVILTVIISWAVIALQDYSSFHPGGRHIMRRVAWPVFYGYEQTRMMMVAVRKLVGRRR